MRNEIVLTVDDVTISYDTGKNASYRTHLKRLFGKIDDSYSSHKRFTAIKNVSFEIKEGETLGIIGENGSGKSTLLRAIAGIYGPNEGTISTYGRSCALLALGSGFQTRLNGVQNIYLAGYAMGLSKEQIEEKIEEIIEYSEIGKFIYQPVKTYSSGMYSKLAFAISSAFPPDILLLDEVMSVGDMRFREKSNQRMKELINDEQRSVILVSHNMPTIKEICNKVLWLNKGRVAMFGDADEVINEYQQYMRSSKANKESK